MKRKNRKTTTNTPTIIDTPQGKLITPHVDKLGNNIGPMMLMDVSQFLQLLREDQEENEVVE